jgi:hypothetical protein
MCYGTVFHALNGDSVAFASEVLHCCHVDIIDDGKAKQYKVVLPSNGL